jgi:hypothetical protein
MRTPEHIDMRAVSQWIHDLEDGVIAVEDREGLMELMRSSEEVRELYLRHAEMAALIHQTASTKAELGTMPVSIETLRREKRRSAVVSLSYAAAAMLMLGLGLWWFQVGMNGGPAGEWIALDASTDARYAVVRPEDHKRPQNRLAPGDQINLARGLLKFEFPSGVEALIEGPAQLEMISESTLRLDKGMGWFRVPQNARGFTVRTELAQVIDLGTEFGIRFDPRGDLEVHVAKGLVKVVPSVPGAPDHEIAGGQARGFDISGGSRPLDPSPSLFRREFSKPVPHAHWSFDAWNGSGFPASGAFPDIEEFTLRPARLDGGEVKEEDCTTTGYSGHALSLKGDGLFAQSSFPGIGGNAPCTIAAWVKFRGGYPVSSADPRTGLGANTPFGQQAYLLNYTNARLSTAQGATGQALEAGVTYTLSFHTANLPGEGAVEYQADLVAFDADEDDGRRKSRPPREDAGVVLVTASGLVSRSDFSERGIVSFTPRADDPNLGKELGIRLVKAGGPVLYDHVQLSRTRAGAETVVFSESFENPVVMGYAESVLPAENWIGPDLRVGGFGSNRHGIFSKRPVCSAPFLCWTGPASKWAAFLLPNHKPVWCVTDGTVFHDAEAPIIGGEWIHVATVHTGRKTEDGVPEVLHFIDGTAVPMDSRPLGGTGRAIAAHSAASMFIGALPGAEPGSPTLDADIDELHILRAALSEKEIVTLMEQNVPVFQRK